MVMRLRRLQKSGIGKYAVINLEKIQRLRPNERDAFERLLESFEREGLLTFGRPNSEEEFFVIKLKDRFASFALRVYAGAAEEYEEYRAYANDVYELADRAGSKSPFCKLPD